MSSRIFPRLTVVLSILQKFLLHGRFIFGPDVRSLFLTILLIVAPVAIFCVFVARKLMDDFSDHWGISIMVIVVVFTVYVSQQTLTLYFVNLFVKILQPLQLSDG